MELTQSGAIVADTPEDIDFFRLAALKSALGIEVSTGMKMHRGVSTLAVARTYGFEGRTKKQAYEFISNLVESRIAQKGGAA